jgi:hypothetical protein
MNSDTGKPQMKEIYYIDKLMTLSKKIYFLMGSRVEEVFGKILLYQSAISVSKGTLIFVLATCGFKFCIWHDLS